MAGAASARHCRTCREADVLPWPARGAHQQHTTLIRFVQVVVRCRPISSKEKAEGRQQIVTTDVREGQVRVQNPKAATSEPAKVFTYDQVYGTDSKQLEVFSVTAKPIVDSVMEGYNGTIFAYGQTGTGVRGTYDYDCMMECHCKEWCCQGGRVPRK